MKKTQQNVSIPQWRINLKWVYHRTNQDQWDQVVAVIGVQWDKASNTLRGDLKHG